MHKKKKKTSKTHYTTNVVTVNAWCYLCAWDFFPCSEHEYVLLLFITMALWVSGLIRATLVLFNLLVVQPEPTIKILCFMIKLYKKFSRSDKAFSFSTCIMVKNQLSCPVRDSFNWNFCIHCLHLSQCCWYQQMSTLSVQLVNNKSWKEQMFFKFDCLFCSK